LRGKNVAKILWSGTSRGRGKSLSKTHEKRKLSVVRFQEPRKTLQEGVREKELPRKKGREERGSLRKRIGEGFTG